MLGPCKTQFLPGYAKELDSGTAASACCGPLAAVRSPGLPGFAWKGLQTSGHVLQAWAPGPSGARPKATEGVAA